MLKFLDNLYPTINREVCIHQETNNQDIKSQTSAERTRLLAHHTREVFPGSLHDKAHQWSTHLDGYQSVDSPATEAAERRRRSQSVDGLINVLDVEDEHDDEDPLLYVCGIIKGPILLILIGLMCALVGFVIIFLVNKGTAFRISLVSEKGDFLPLQWSSYWPMLRYIVFALGMSTTSCFVTQYFCPAAGSSGLPEIRSILGGTIKPVLLSTRLVLVKAVGLVLALVAGLSVGKEGPFVHIAAAVADNLMQLRPFLSIHDMDGKRLEILSHACAAGVAASFGTAFGSVLFALEFTSTSYVFRMMPEAFFTAVVAITIIRQFGAQPGEVLFTNSHADAHIKIHEKGSAASTFEIFVFIGIGLLGGILGVSFNAIVDKMSKVRNRLFSTELYPPSTVYRRKLVMVIVVTLIVAPLQYFEIKYGLHGNDPSHYLFETSWIPPIKHEDDQVACFTPSLQLMLFFPYKFIVTALSVILPLPVGLFTPVFQIGGVMGRLIGELVTSLAGHGSSVAELGNFLPREYALIGAAAFSTGVTRAISTAVIIFELSNNPALCLPISLAICSSYFLSQRLYKNIYDALMDTGGLPYMQELPSSERYVPVTQVMDIIGPQDVLSIGDTYRRVLEQHLNAQNVLMNAPLQGSEATILRTSGAIYSFASADFVPLVKDRHSMQFVGLVQKEHLLKAIHDFLPEFTRGALDACNNDEENNLCKERLRGLDLHTTIDAVRANIDKEVNFMFYGNSSPLRATDFDRTRERYAYSHQLSMNTSAATGMNSSPYQDTSPEFWRHLAHDDASVSSPDSQSMPPVYVEPSPFQLIDTCMLSKVELCFRRLKLNTAYVVTGGRLIGVLTYTKFCKYIGRRAKRPLATCFRLLRAVTAAVFSFFCDSSHIERRGSIVSSLSPLTNSAQSENRGSGGGTPVIMGVDGRGAPLRIQTVKYNKMQPSGLPPLPRTENNLFNEKNVSGGIASRSNKL